MSITFALSMGWAVMTAAEPPRIVAQPVPVSSVRLLPSRFASSQEANGRYLLELDPDRLLHGFYVNAGLPPKAEHYGGWESMGVAGHTLGHYLTACSLQYAATGDVRFRQRVEHIVEALAVIQAAREDGYIGAIPESDRLWNEIRRGEIRSQGFDLNGVWVPWYTQHKVFAGLIDAYRFAGQDKALVIVRRLGEWAIEVTSGLNDEQWQRMLACEFGGMNESLAELYVLTGEERFLDLARKFHHRYVLDPLARREDRLAGLHGNTQIPKVIGLARKYEVDGRPEDRVAAEFFWTRIVNYRTFAMGGNSDREHWVEPSRLSDQLSIHSAETCNTYNMLKLTRHLHGWDPRSSWFDFYERALFNHIAGSQRHEDGMMAYYVPLQPMATRPFSTPFDSFWCCVGTGIENHARYGEAIFTRLPNELKVNLYIPCRLDDPESGAKLKIEGEMPETETIRITIDSLGRDTNTLALRRPAWVASEPVIRVNGTPTEAILGADGYLRLTRSWVQGDVVEVRLPMQLHLDPMPDNPNRVAVMYGPVVLVTKHEPGVEGPSPVLVDPGKPLDAWFERLPGTPLRFRSQGVIRPEDLELVTFADAKDIIYTTYLDLFTDEQWAIHERAFLAEMARRQAYERATVDVFHPGEMQEERDHQFQGENTQTGEHLGRRWRHAGGWFSFVLQVPRNQPVELVVDLWSGDVGRHYDIYVDDVRIATPVFEAGDVARFIQMSFPLPAELTRDKESVRVRFVARQGSIAGGLYGARTIRPDLMPTE